MKIRAVRLGFIVLAVAIASALFVSSGMGAAKAKPKGDPPELIAKGKALYAKAPCPSCHGPEGKGDGPAGKGFPADHKPANFTTGVFKFGGDDAKVRESISKGRPPYMPPNPNMKEDEVAALSAFVRSLGPKKP